MIVYDVAVKVLDTVISSAQHCQPDLWHYIHCFVSVGRHIHTTHNKSSIKFGLEFECCCCFRTFRTRGDKERPSIITVVIRWLRVLRKGRSSCLKVFCKKSLQSAYKCIKKEIPTLNFSKLLSTHFLQNISNMTDSRKNMEFFQKQSQWLLLNANYMSKRIHIQHFLRLTMTNILMEIYKKVIRKLFLVLNFCVPFEFLGMFKVAFPYGSVFFSMTVGC